MKNNTCTILLVPGYADSGPEHWQGIWLDHFPESVKVVQKDWIHIDPESWVEALDSAIQSNPEPLLLVCHSLGCSALLFWIKKKKTAPLIHKMKGALLVAPPDPNSKAYRSLSIQGFDPLPLDRIPFKTILVASGNDPFLSDEKAQHYAKCWGSEFVHIGKKGHIGEDSGLGEWREGKELLKKLFLVF